MFASRTIFLSTLLAPSCFYCNESVCVCVCDISLFCLYLWRSLIIQFYMAKIDEVWNSSLSPPLRHMNAKIKRMYEHFVVFFLFINFFNRLWVFSLHYCYRCCRGGNMMCFAFPLCVYIIIVSSPLFCWDVVDVLCLCLRGEF